MMPEALDIRKRLDYIEGELTGGGRSPGEMGFWKMVNRVKQDPELIAHLADQIGRIDAAVFRERAWLLVPLWLGHALELVATLLGLGMVWYGTGSTGTSQGLALVAGSLVLITTLHPLAHYAVGRLVGIRFLFYFPDGPALIEPTLKTDYATYLRASPLERAAMHAAGPLATTLVFILTFLLAYIYQAPEWTLWALGGFLVLNTPLELAPLLLVKLGMKKFSRSDSYRTLREWRLHRALASAGVSNKDS